MKNFVIIKKIDNGLYLLLYIIIYDSKMCSTVPRYPEI